MPYTTAAEPSGAVAKAREPPVPCAAAVAAATTGAPQSDAVGARVRTATVPSNPRNATVKPPSGSAAALRNGPVNGAVWL